MKASGIYAIRNQINGKRYVGSAVYLTGRFCDHRKRLRLGKHHSIKLQRAWNKYGETNFSFEILEFVPDKAALIAAEQKWISTFNAACPRRGYNISPTAGNCLGVKHSAQSVANIRAAILRRPPPSPEVVAKRAAGLKGHRPWSRGRVCTPETLAKMSAANKGKVLSAEHRAKISEARKGIIFPAETIARMSAAHIGHKQSEETRSKRSESLRVSWARRKANGGSVGPANPTA